MADIVISVANKAASYLGDPILTQLKYLFCFAANIHNLSNAIEDLRSKREAVQLVIEEARGDQITGPDVLNWLKRVDETNELVKDILEARGNVKCVNIKSRYVLSKKATKIYEEILELYEKGSFERVVYPAPQVQVPYATSRDFGGFESRMFTKRQILEALGDNLTRVIGICGMAGVGKTVIAKEIADHVKENGFHKVAMAVVSQISEPEKEESKNQLIMKIQDQLADELNFSISEKNSLHARVQSISTVLQKERDHKILIILDDLWNDLDLQEIGIPPTNLCKGLKVLLTSRFRDVCKITGAQKIFEVEVLTREETWHLFKETAEISNDATELEGIAKEVAEQCGRLPLAIVTVAKALRNKRFENSIWCDALEQLRNCSVTNIKGVHDFVYSRIEWSYNYLESKDAKSVLLLCSLFPEDFEIPIEVLVIYVKGLELFQRTNTMKNTRDRMNSVIHDLKDCYLLLDCEDENFVTMHDVVRDVCLIISSKKKLGYMVSHFGIMEGPHNNHKPYRAASLTVGQLEQLPYDLDCSNLELLRIAYQNQKKVLKVPMDFLPEVNSLKVLYFEKVKIQSPLSLKSLMNICSLFLHKCKLDRMVLIVSGLDNLQILSFLRCELFKFPKGIETLRNLKSLNLQFKRCPDPLPKEVLCGLKKLEELYLEDYCQRRDGGDAHAFDEQHVVEINSLSHLNMLVISGTEGTIFQEQILKTLNLRDTTRFYIGSGSCYAKKFFQFPRKFHGIMQVRHIDGGILQNPNISRIMRKTQSLYLGEVKCLKNVVPELEKDGFVNLRELCLDGGDISNLIDVTNLVSGNIFHNLEHLSLNNLENLIEISNGKLGVGSFRRVQRVYLEQLPKMKCLWRHYIPSLSNLKFVYVRYCDAVKYLFPESILKCLLLLEELQIWDCKNLEEIVSKEEASSSAATQILELPKLRHIGVWKTKFTSFCNCSGSLQAILYRVSFPNMKSIAVDCTDGPKYLIGSELQMGSLHQLENIYLSECEHLQSLFVPLPSQYYHLVQLLPSLKLIKLKKCPLVEVLLDFEGMMINNEDDIGGGEYPSIESKPVVLFEGLKDIELRDMDRLKQLWRIPRDTTIVIKAFQNLRNLRVGSCQSLRHLLSASMAQMLVNLENLRIWNCDMMEEVIARGEDITTTLVFSKLRVIELSDLQNLRVVFGSININFLNSNDELVVLASLTRLDLRNCPVLTKFCVGPNLSAPNLKEVRVLPEHRMFVPEDLKDKEIIFVDKYGREIQEWLVTKPKKSN